jgi:sensor histidine kinase regulating citrate/malate metabolism
MKPRLDDAMPVLFLLRLHHQGSAIAANMLQKIFEYGVSDQPDATAQGNRGQGLFVARTYMAKMGGTIAAENVADGVVFVLRLGVVG